jgi:hypothetical protein
MPALLIGLWYHFRKEINYEERFLITAFITMNIAMMVLRYCYIQLHVSQRWSLPLITFTFFYIPIGLHVIANWLERKSPMNKQKSNVSKRKGFSWFLVLLLVGICICIPKLFRPIRIEKQGYRDVAKWLRQNSAPTDVIAVQDKRISFYAERKRLRYDKKIPQEAKYIVGIVKDEDEMLQWDRSMQKRYSVWADKREKKKMLVIYEVP